MHKHSPRGEGCKVDRGKTENFGSSFSTDQGGKGGRESGQEENSNETKSMFLLTHWDEL